MSLSAAAVRLLAEKGLSAFDIAEIMEANERKPKDATGAERQARFRERNALRNAVTEESTPFPAPPKDNNQTPPTHTPVYINPVREAFPKLDCADQQLWADFLKNRKAKTLPNTATAHKKLKNDLTRWSQETGWPPGEVFAACVARGWGAIYDPRDKNDGKPKQSRNQPDGMGVTERAARQAMHEISGGVGRFDDCREEISSSHGSGNRGIIDTVPNTVRSVGYAGSG